MEEDPEDTFADIMEQLAVALDSWASDNLSDAVVSLDEAYTKLGGLRDRLNQKLTSKED